MERMHWNERLGIPVRHIKPGFGVLVGEEGKRLSFERDGFQKTLAAAADERSLVLVKSLSPDQRAQLRGLHKDLDWKTVPERSNYSCTPHSDDIGGSRAVSALWAQARLPGVNTGFSSVQVGAKALLQNVDLLNDEISPHRKNEWEDFIDLLRHGVAHLHEGVEGLTDALEGAHLLRTHVPGGSGHPFVRAVHADLARKAVWANWLKVELAVISGSAFHFGGKGRLAEGDILVCDVLPIL